MKRKRTVQELAERYRKAPHGERLFTLARLREANKRELMQAVRAKRRARG